MNKDSLQINSCNNEVNRDPKYIQEGIVNILNMYISSIESGRDWVDPDTLYVKEISDKRFSIYFEFVSM